MAALAMRSVAAPHVPSYAGGGAAASSALPAQLSPPSPPPAGGGAQRGHLVRLRAAEAGPAARPATARPRLPVRWVAPSLIKCPPASCRQYAPCCAVLGTMFLRTSPSPAGCPAYWTAHSLSISSMFASNNAAMAAPDIPTAERPWRQQAGLTEEEFKASACGGSSITRLPCLERAAPSPARVSPGWMKGMAPMLYPAHAGRVPRLGCE